MPVPSTPQGGPDYPTYYAQCANALPGLLAARLPAQHELDSFLLPLKLYFVNDNRLFHGLLGAVSQIQKDAKTHLTGASRPNRKELDHIRIGDPMGLFSILRIHHAFIDLASPRAAGTATHTRLNGAQLGNGLNQGSIVASAHRFDRSQFQRLCAQHNITSAAVAQQLLARGFQRNADVLLKELEDGYTPQGAANGGLNGRKRRQGAYRVTDKLATMIAEAISQASGAAISQQQVMATLFDTDPRTGPGNGTMTQALPLNLGNLL